MKTPKEKTGNWEGRQILNSLKRFIASLMVGYFSDLSQLKISFCFLEVFYMVMQLFGISEWVWNTQLSRRKLRKLPLHTLVKISVYVTLEAPQITVIL